MFVTLMPTGTAIADFAVIVNKDNPVVSMGKSDVKNIFLGKKTFWPDGSGIDVYLQRAGKAHRSFVLEILRKSPQQLSMYWKQALFSGTGIPPNQLQDDQSVIKAVADNAGAIGYIAPEHIDTTVKALELK